MKTSLTCPNCGTVFAVKPSQSERRRFCSKPCQGAWQSAHNTGPNNHAWQGGCAPYYGPTWRPAMRAARARDKVCQHCGKSPTELGKALDVHHLVPFRAFGLARHAKANDLANLVSYCSLCHLAVEWETNRKDPAYARWGDHATLDARPQRATPYFPEQRGTDHPRARLSDQDIMTIRADFAAHKATQIELADRYGVKQAHISGIVLGKSWKHLPHPGNGEAPAPLRSGRPRAAAR